MQLEVAGGSVAVESDLLGLALSHRQGFSVETKRLLVPPLAIHLMGRVDFAHRRRHISTQHVSQIQRRTKIQLELIEIG